MSIRRVLLSVSLGFIIAVLALGLLPFLTVYTWSELMGVSEAAGLTELLPAPLLIYIRKALGDEAKS